MKKKKEQRTEICKEIKNKKIIYKYLLQYIKIFIMKNSGFIFYRSLNDEE